MERVETARPLRIANAAKALAKTNRANGNDVEAEVIESAAKEIERLYQLLGEALDVAKKATDLA